MGGGALITSQKLRYTAAQEDSVNAVVTSLTQDPPHAFPVDVTLNVPNPVPHRLRIYSTPDESVGTLVAEFTYDPTYTNVKVRLPLQLEVGGIGEFDPADGSISTPVNVSLQGWDWYPEVRGMGGTLANMEYTKGESVPGNGYDYFTLTGERQFVAPDFIFIHFEPQISLSQPVFTYLNLYTGIKEVTATQTMDATYYRQLVEIVTAGTTPTITLLPLANVPGGTLLTFSTHRGSQKQATIKAAVGEVIFFDGGNGNAIYMGQGELVWLLRADNGWHVTNDWRGMSRVGEQWDGEVLRPNVIRFNGGGLEDGGGNPLPLPRATYPRAEWYAFNVLPGGLLMSKTDRDTGGINAAGFWAYDATNIWAPDYRGMFKRALPGIRTGLGTARNSTSKTGSYEPHLTEEHNHTDPNKPNFNRLLTWAGAPDGLGGHFTGAIFSGTYNDGRPKVHDTAVLTAFGGPETRSKNIGITMGCYI